MNIESANLILEKELTDCAKHLNALIVLARKTHPNAEFYIAGGGTLNLMSGPHHENGPGNGAAQIARPDRIIASELIKFTDCGDW